MKSKRPLATGPTVDPSGYSHRVHGGLLMVNTTQGKFWYYLADMSGREQGVEIRNHNVVRRATTCHRGSGATIAGTHPGSFVKTNWWDKVAGNATYVNGAKIRPFAFLIRVPRLCPDFIRCRERCRGSCSQGMAEKSVLRNRLGGESRRTSHPQQTLVLVRSESKNQGCSTDRQDRSDWASFGPSSRGNPSQRVTISKATKPPVRPRISMGGTSV